MTLTDHFAVIAVNRNRRWPLQIAGGAAINFEDDCDIDHFGVIVVNRNHQWPLEIAGGGGGY